MSKCANVTSGKNEELSQKLVELFQALHKEPDPSKVLIEATQKKKWRGNEKFPRSSRYRGVSKNGTKWQVIKS